MPPWKAWSDRRRGFSDNPGTHFETVDPPTYPLTSSSPSRLLVTGARVVIGLVAGVLAAKLIDLLLAWAARSRPAAEPPNRTPSSRAFTASGLARPAPASR